MGIAHCHCQSGMAEHSLQSQDVTAIHHVVTGEGVTQHVGQLALGHA